MRLFCITISLALCLSGCRTHIQYVPVESKHDSVYIDRLVPYPVPADSATIKALVECDKMGKVVLRWLDMANSRNVDLQFKLDSLGYVIADMRIKQDTLYLPSREIYVDKYVEVPVEVPVEVERGLSIWEQMCIRLFPYAAGLSSVLLILVARKPITALIRRFI